MLVPVVMTDRHRILYLMEDTELSGGVRVVLAQADALIRRGHEVTIATKGAPLRWRESTAEWLHLDDFLSIDASVYDFVIGTFWTTVPAAREIAGDRAVHLCQGYEGSFAAYAAIRSEIDAVYRLPVPKIVVSAHLLEVLRPFDVPTFWAGQIVDDVFYRTSSPRDEPPLRVLLPGPAQIDIKGIDVGYGAVTHARWHGAEFRLVRVSPWGPAGDEPLTELDAEFHTALDTPAMASLMHSCDILLATSRPEEGFGLPAAEALASGLAVVMTSIPSFRGFDARHDYASFVEPDDPVAMGDALMQLIDDARLRTSLRRRGRVVADQFREHHAAERIERILGSLRLRSGA